jgi:hypothetical protein
VEGGGEGGWVVGVVGEEVDEVVMRMWTLIAVGWPKIAPLKTLQHPPLPTKCVCIV